MSESESELEFEVESLEAEMTEGEEVGLGEVTGEVGMDDLVDVDGLVDDEGDNGFVDGFVDEEAAALEDTPNGIVDGVEWDCLVV